MRNRIARRGCISLTGGILLGALLLPWGQAYGLPQSKPKQSCINELNKNLAKVAKVQSKDICACIKDGSKGKLSGTIEDCLTSDPKGKVLKATQKTVSKAGDKCSGESPDFGATDAGTVNQAAIAKELSMFHKIFSPDLDTFIIGFDDDKAGSKCQIDVAKAAKKCQDAKLKSFNTCKKLGLKDESIDDTNGLEACMGDNTKVKIAKACVEKLGGKISKKCTTPGVDLAAAFPGFDPNQDLREYVDFIVECEVCLVLNTADALSRDCDLFDDGLLNTSCSEPEPPVGIDAELVTDQVSVPVHIAAPPLDPNDPNAPERLFVVEQSGRIRLIKDGALEGTPFLDIDSLVLSPGDAGASGNEQGLLSVAFHPDYANNGRFFVNYTRDPGGATVVARYEVSGNPDLADPNSAATLLTIAQPFANHNGGQVAFGSDSYLYIGTGDGGAAGDPGDRAQDDGELLGKMLRLDVDSTDLGNYGIPPDNPHLIGTDPNELIPDEIWAKGLRNPFRFSFDRATGDLYIADVGQNLIEEIDFQPASSTGGENWGWRLLEGSDCFNPASNCDPGMLTTLPIHEYTHAIGNAIIGGFVYRGSDIPGLQGTYFYSDNQFPSFVRTFEQLGGIAVNHLVRTSDLEDAGASLDVVTSFGEDAHGELYIADGDGDIYKIVAEP